MSEHMKECLSAAVDGEASEEDMQLLFDKLHTDSELRQNWTNYHIVSTVIRGQKLTHNQQSPPDWRALADKFPDDVGNIIKLERRSLRPAAKWSRNIGIAIAACLVVAVGVFYNLGDSATIELAEAVSDPNSSTSELNPSTRNANVMTQFPILQRHPRASEYIVEHDKDASISNRHPIPYVKFVSHKPSSRD